jgi:ribosomal protein S18 acetylase RimI-like enzyme
MPTLVLTDRLRGPLAGEVGLRPAVAVDEPFLYQVYASTREEELALVGWDDDQKGAFLQMQFRAQSFSYRQQFSGSGYEVILKGDQPVGRLFVHRGAGEIRVVDIGLLPEHRNQGIGGALLQAVLHEADETWRPVRLHVGTFNRAVKLYERLGFVPIRTDGIYVEMEWSPRIPLESPEKGCSEASRRV